VMQSLTLAAASVGVDLLILDNCYDSATALRNADQFVKSRVDLVIEFQVREEIAPVIADKIAGANIPLIAVDIPHPHAIYFGVDNYRSGFIAGQALAAHALKAWNGKVEWVIGLDLPEAGPLVQSRITGAFEGVRLDIPSLSMESFIRIDSRGRRDSSMKAIADFLQLHPAATHVLIAAANDDSALGALDAVYQQKREKHVAIVGQGCTPATEAAMRKSCSSLIGSVSHEARSYGPSLVSLGLAMLREQMVPPYNCVKHKMVTPESLGSRDGLTSRTIERSLGRVKALMPVSLRQQGTQQSYK
jgi:ribose transport system substrate-binding protein